VKKELGKVIGEVMDKKNCLFQIVGQSKRG